MAAALFASQRCASRLDVSPRWSGQSLSVHRRCRQWCWCRCAAVGTLPAAPPDPRRCYCRPLEGTGPSLSHEVHDHVTSLVRARTCCLSFHRPAFWYAKAGQHSVASRSPCITARSRKARLSQTADPAGLSAVIPVGGNCARGGAVSLFVGGCGFSAPTVGFACGLGCGFACGLAPPGFLTGRCCGLAGAFLGLPFVGADQGLLLVGAFLVGLPLVGRGAVLGWLHTAEADLAGGQPQTSAPWLRAPQTAPPNG